MMEDLNIDQTKLVDIPTKYYKRSLDIAGVSFEDSSVLDFGCGSGIVSLGIGKYCKPKKVIGVEINRDFEYCQKIIADKSIDLTDAVIPDYQHIKPFENLGANAFDIAVSWSVLEHIDRRHVLRQMEIIYRALKPGGVCVFQVAPLYWSAEGHHLFGIIPDWSHLYMMDSELEELILNKFDASGAKSLLGMYKTLNKFTIPDFDEVFNKVGFNVLDKFVTKRDKGLPLSLLKAYDKETLITEQVVWTLRKP